MRTRPWAMVIVALVATAAAAAPPRHVHKVAAPVATAAPMIRPVVPEGVLGLSDMIAFARYHQQFKPKDSFEARPSEADLDGKPFEVTVPLSNSGANSAGFWQYKADDQRLEISFETQMWSRSTFVEDVTDATAMGSTYGWGFYLTFASRDGRGYTGSNAFGATAEVDVMHQSAVGLIAAPGSPTFVTDLFKTQSINMPPEQARQAVAGARIVIRGTLRAYAQNKVVMCGTEYISATLDNPLDVDTHICALSAVFTDIRAVSASGEILATWDANTPKP